MRSYPITAAFLVLLLIQGLFGSLPGPARAENGPREVTLQLAELVSIDEIDKEDQINLKENQINLVTASNTFQFSLPIAGRAEISKLVLHLDILHSSALLKERSQIRIQINGVVVSQIGMDPLAPHIVADIPVPLGFLRKGYNKVEFLVAQHYTDDCEDPTAPELWTQVNTIKSYFYFLYDYKPLRFTLANLDELFDKRLVEYGLTIMRTKPAAEYTDTDLAWGGLAVEGASLRLDYRPLTLHLATATPVAPARADDPLARLDQSGLGTDAILIGTKDELAPFLAEPPATGLAAAITGPYVGVFPAADPRFQIVVLSGTTDAEVSRAVEAFSFNRFAFPADNAMVVQELTIPTVEPDKLPRLLQPGVTYSFKDLGYQSTSKISHKRIELPFTVPSDLTAREKANVSVHLDFSYGAALREDSVLNIYLNGLFEQAIHLDNKAGGRIVDYEFFLPMTSLQPGLNTLRFEPVLTPLVTGRCTTIQSGNAVFSLFETSTVELPLADHYTKLPDFKRFSRTGFPYLQTASGADLGVVVRGRNAGAILAAWQLLAKLTQIADMPLHQAKISFRTIDDRHLLIVGDRQSLYEDDLRYAPVQLGKDFEFAYPIAKESVKEPPTLVERLRSLIDPLLPEQEGAMKQLYANIKFRSRLGKDGLLVGYESAANPGRLVTLLTHEDPDLLPICTLRLTRADFWDVLDNNLAVWNEDDYSLITHQTQAEFFVGHTSLPNTLAYYFSIHKIKLLLAAGVLLLVVAWTSHRLLNAYQRRRHANATELET